MFDQLTIFLSDCWRLCFVLQTQNILNDQGGQFAGMSDKNALSRGVNCPENGGSINSEQRGN